MNLEINERLNSCKILINAKGQWSGEVKVYELVANVAVEKAILLSEKLQLKLDEKNNRNGK